MKIKYTDAHRYARPYVNAEASRVEGYLAKRFAEIRAEQAAAAQATSAEVAPMKKRGSA